MDAVEVSLEGDFSDFETLTPNGSKARFGVAYLKTICSQAGVGISETPADEDVNAVDCAIDFEVGSVRVQVKCSAQFRVDGRSASWPVEPTWRLKWAKCGVPVYLVLVIVGNDEAHHWLDHLPKGTMQHAAAFWVRVNTLKSDQTRINVPKSQRLTAATLKTWESDLNACFA
ncbi:DUF4365 domain-containing protein [Streptosporangium sp. NPDC050280]|uniref:DUF4365 domain-containing protein n=1 Tax=unclassified Streptosporangium TaxID=2632669 RepID=UPI003429BFB9